MHRLLPSVLCLLLTACQIGLPGKPGAADAPASVSPISLDPIAVTSLDAPTAASSAPAAPDQTAPDQTAPDQTAPDQTAPDQTAPDQTAPDQTAPGTAAAPETPIKTPAPKSPEQLACERKGGSYASFGTTSAKTCVRRTRDSGKQCRKESDCEGFCLARSGTCAPITPMLGCNDILQNDGRRVTLCLD